MNSEVFPREVLELIWKDCLNENHTLQDENEDLLALLMNSMPEGEFYELAKRKNVLYTKNQMLTMEKQHLVRSVLILGTELEEETHQYTEEYKKYECLCQKHNEEIASLESIRENMTKVTLSALREKGLPWSNGGADRKKILDKVRSAFENAIIREAKKNNRSSSSVLSLDQGRTSITSKSVFAAPTPSTSFLSNAKVGAVLPSLSQLEENTPVRTRYSPRHARSPVGPSLLDNRPRTSSLPSSSMHQMAMLDRIYTPLDEDLISSVSQNQNKSIKGSRGPGDPRRTPTNQNVTSRREIEGDQELEWYDAIIGNVGTAFSSIGGLTSGDLAAREAEYFRERKGMLEGKKE